MIRYIDIIRKKKFFKTCADFVRYVKIFYKKEYPIYKDNLCSSNTELPLNACCDTNLRDEVEGNYSSLPSKYITEVWFDDTPITIDIQIAQLFLNRIEDIIEAVALTSEGAVILTYDPVTKSFCSTQEDYNKIGLWSSDAQYYGELIFEC